MSTRKSWACMLVAVLIGLAWPAASQVPGKASGGDAPVIACDQPEFNFGGVAQGQDVKHIFTIKNKGKGVLKIERARGG